MLKNAMTRFWKSAGTHMKDGHQMITNTSMIMSRRCRHIHVLEGPERSSVMHLSP